MNNNFLDKKRNRSFNEINPKNFISSSLQIYNYYERILETIENNKITIICGNTGCGKTTQIPKILLGLNYNNDNYNHSILITQPRRIACINIANRINEEYNNLYSNKLINYNIQENIAGYQIKMEKNYTAKNKILVKTTGVFLEELIHIDNSNIEKKYKYIIIDEIHERDINIDLCIALIKRLINLNFLKSKIILMSATINSEKFKNYFNLNNNAIIYISHNLNIRTFFLNEIMDNLNLKKHIQECYIDKPVYNEDLFFIVRKLIRIIYNSSRQTLSDILIFCPGLNEILLLKKYIETIFRLEYDGSEKIILESNNNKIDTYNENPDDRDEIEKELSKNIEIYILHSQLSTEEQKYVFKKTKKRKIILATNIAESSLTFPNLDYIIDFCLIKQQYYEEETDMEKLELKWSSKANCLQRQGRCGRIRNGFVFRLISFNFFQKLENYNSSELIRTNLQKVILDLAIFNCKDIEDVLKNCIDCPDKNKIEFAFNNLFLLCALDKEKKITNIGRIYADLPICLNYTKLILIFYAFNKIDYAITIVSILYQNKKLFKTNGIQRTDLFDCLNYFNKFNFNNDLNINLCYDDDVLISYIAFSYWLYLYGKNYIRKILNDAKIKIDFNEQNEILINQNRFFMEMFKNLFKFENEDLFLKKYNLDKQVLIEILKTQINLKYRLNKHNFYEESNIYKIKIEDITIENVNLLKWVYAGCFYENILNVDYDNLKNTEINEETFKKESKIIKFFNVPTDKLKLLHKFFKSFDTNCSIQFLESEIIVQFSNYEIIKKFLFILKKEQNFDNNNDEIIIEINNINFKISKANTFYEYNTFLYLKNSKKKMFIKDDSINYNIISTDKYNIKLEKFVTNKYIYLDKGYKCEYLTKFLNNNFSDILLILIFSPKIFFENSDIKFNHYISFKEKKINSINYYKLDYFLTDRDLRLINEIRQNINYNMKSDLNYYDIEKSNKLINDFNNILNKKRVLLITNEYFINLLTNNEFIKNKFDIYGTDNNIDNNKVDIEINLIEFINNFEHNENDYLYPIKCLNFNESLRLRSIEGEKELQNELKYFKKIKNSISEKINKIRFIENCDNGALYCNSCDNYILEYFNLKEIKNKYEINLYSIDSIFEVDSIYDTINKTADIKIGRLSENIEKYIFKYFKCKKCINIIGFIDVYEKKFLIKNNHLYLKFPFSNKIPLDLLTDKEYNKYKKLNFDDKINFYKTNLTCPICNNNFVFNNYESFRIHQKKDEKHNTLKIELNEFDYELDNILKINNL